MKLPVKGELKNLTCEFSIKNIKELEKFFSLACF